MKTHWFVNSTVRNGMILETIHPKYPSTAQVPRPESTRRNKRRNMHLGIHRDTHHGDLVVGSGWRMSCWYIAFRFVRLFVG
jgi:hypothetical protein